MIFHIFDSGLTDHLGHHYHLDQDLRNALDKRQIKTRIFGTKNLHVEIIDELDAVPFFSADLYGTSRSNKQTAEDYIEDFETLNQIYFDDLNRLDKSEIDSEDVLLFHTIRHNQIKGLGKWLNSFGDKLPYIVMIVPFCDFLLTIDGRNVGGELYREAFREFPKGEKILITSTEDKICKIYEGFAGQKVHEIPVPITDFSHRQISQNHNERLRITYLGFGRAGKGTTLLPPVVRRTLSKHKNVEFHIQISPLNEFQKVYDALKDLGDNITLYTDNLTEEVYRNLMDQADIMLMPYKPISYEYSTSGVFTESMALGKVVVVPNNTWLSRELEKYNGGGVTFESDKIKQIYDALDGAISGFDLLSAKARESSLEFKAWHNVSSFLDVIKGLTP